MLGKLLKYEFRATGKVLWPIFGATVLLTLVTRLLMQLGGMRFETTTTQTGELYSLSAANGIFNALITMLSLLLVLAYLAVGVGVVVLVILRFYKNLLGDEGYLMFTLPVRPGQLLASKLIVGVAWSVGAVALMLACFALLIGGVSDVGKLLGAGWRQLSTWLTGGTGVVLLVEMIALLVVGSAYTFLETYVAMAFGGQYPGNRLLISVGAFVCIRMVLQVLTTLGVFVMGLLLSGNIGVINTWVDSHVVQSVQIILGAGIVLCALGSIIWAFVTRWLLSKKLNLA